MFLAGCGGHSSFLPQQSYTAVCRWAMASNIICLLCWKGTVWHSPFSRGLPARWGVEGTLTLAFMVVAGHPLSGSFWPFLFFFSDSSCLRILVISSGIVPDSACWSFSLLLVCLGGGQRSCLPYTPQACCPLGTCREAQLKYCHALLLTQSP